MSPISAIILAAGESKRMPGQNKLLLPFAGKTIIECTVDAILQAKVDEAIIVLGHEAEAIRGVLQKRPVRFVDNPDYRSGMASSIHAGIAALSPTAPAVLITLADQPLIQPAELNLLISAFWEATNHFITVPTFAGRRGNPVIFDLRYRAELLNLKGDAGGKAILQRHPEAVLEVEMPAGNILEDADTSEAYARIKGLAKNKT